MYLRVLAALAALFALASITVAEARPRYQSDREQSDDDESSRPAKRHVNRRHSSDDADDSSSSRRRRSASRRHRDSDDGDRAERHSGVGPRPDAWCGWYMRTRHGGGPEMNVAANWRKYGSPGSPQVGAIVV